MPKIFEIIKSNKELKISVIQASSQKLAKAVLKTKYPKCQIIELKAVGSGFSENGYC